jgi:hypothetical protein
VETSERQVQVTYTEPVWQLLDISQLAGYLVTSVRPVRRLVTERRVPFIDVGGLISFDPAEVGRWLDCNRYGAGESA